MTRKILGISVIMAAFVVSGTVVYYPMVGSRSTTAKAVFAGVPAGQLAETNPATAAKRVIPEGSLTTQVGEPNNDLPAFRQVTIDPVDVHVGDVQKFMVVFDDPSEITSVVATIVTDHKTITVPLVSAGAPKLSELSPRYFYVDATNKVVFTKVDQNIARMRSGPGIANAAGPGGELKFTGQWTVEDTHAAFYKTIFTAKDAAGHENSITRNWMDYLQPLGSYYGTFYASWWACCGIGAIYVPSGWVGGSYYGDLHVNWSYIEVQGGGYLGVIPGYTIHLDGGTIYIDGGGHVGFYGSC